MRIYRQKMMGKALEKNELKRNEDLVLRKEETGELFQIK